MSALAEDQTVLFKSWNNYQSEQQEKKEVKGKCVFVAKDITILP